MSDPRHSPEERSEALRSYAILDTPPEQGFDDVVRLACTICRTPIAIISLLDEARSWFKAKVGADDTETPLAESVCAHVLLQHGLLIIPDLAEDPRTRESVFVTRAPSIRFYAGARLETPEGVALGTLCVIDMQPRPEGLTVEQASSLEALARQVMAQLELRRAVAGTELLIQEAHHRVKNSLQMVQSLLTLQAKASAYPEAAQQLLESAGRVRTFGAMHENLYRVDAAARVDLSAYLGSLMDDQRDGLASTMGRSVSFHPSPAWWPSAQAPSIGLIVLELVTNALKYGEGRITVTLAQASDWTVLTVEDEGTGLEQNFDQSRSTGLGMRILTGLLRGQKGRLEVDRSRGHTCFVATLRTPPS